MSAEDWISGEDPYSDDRDAEDQVLSYEKIEHETEKAVFFCVSKDKNQYVWLPKSQIVIHEQSKEIQVPAWLSINKVPKK